MLIQLPLAIKTKSFKGTVFGNFFFWMGILVGIPLIMVLYMRIDEIKRNG